MDTFLGIMAIASIVILLLAIRSALRPPRAGGRAGVQAATRPVRGAPRPPQPRGAPGEPSAGDEVSGWLIGHELARGRDGFPGDPLPGGHLGSAADVAFWGGVFDDDEDEDG